MTDRNQIEAANLYHSYMRGWRDGATASAKRPEFETHADAEIREAYADGLNFGYASREVAVSRARIAYGHVPSILRAQDVETKT